MDRKRVKEMLAQDLPGKPRYPIFSAAFGHCLATDILETEKMEREVSPETKTAAQSDVSSTGTNNVYSGQGAYIDGHASFVDLEANTPTGVDSNTKHQKEEVQAEQQAVASVIKENEGAPQEEASDLSDSSNSSDSSDPSGDAGESSEESDNRSDDPRNMMPAESVRGSSGPCTDSWESDFSDDDDVVYTISSDEETTHCDGKIMSNP